MPSNRIIVTRDGERYRIDCFDHAGKAVRVRRSPQFPTIAMRRAWAVEQASRFSQDFHLYWDEEVNEDNHGQED